MSGGKLKMSYVPAKIIIQNFGWKFDEKIAEILVKNLVKQISYYQCSN